MLGEDAHLDKHLVYFFLLLSFFEHPVGVVETVAATEEQYEWYSDHEDSCEPAQPYRHARVMEVS